MGSLDRRVDKFRNKMDTRLGSVIGDRLPEKGKPPASLGGDFTGSVVPVASRGVPLDAVRVLGHQKVKYNASTQVNFFVDNKVKQVCAGLSYSAVQLVPMLDFGRKADKINRQSVGETMVQEVHFLVSEFARRGVVVNDMWAVFYALCGWSHPAPTCSAGPDVHSGGVTPFQIAGDVAADYLSMLWTTAGDGHFTDATVEHPFYAPGMNDVMAGSVVLTVTVQPIAPNVLAVHDDMTLTIP